MMLHALCFLVSWAPDAIERAVREPERHGEAALAMARSHVDSDRMLSDLLQRALGAKVVRS
jgi:hypothetical protein